MAAVNEGIEVDCPVHGRVRARYRQECFWWECPEMVDCGFVVTREQLVEGQVPD